MPVSHPDDEPNEGQDMTNAIEPGDAGAALAEIRRREAQVIEAGIVPVWFWWVVAAASVALGMVVDGRNAAAIAVAAIVYAIGMAGLTASVIVGGLRRVKVREAMLGPDGAGLIVAFVGIVVIGTIALAFALEAIGVAQAGTLSTLACGAALVIGGPLLMRRLRIVMLRRRAGAR
jgi:hypothetical protein